ncbi:MAG: hypothetical protein RLZZ73_660, partial [Actinomycetota bacterium]
LLPGGRPVADAPARVDIATVWGVPSLPSEAGRSTSQIIEALENGSLDSVVVGGVDPLDLPNSQSAVAALSKAFVVSLEIAPSAVTEVADVVLPVAAVTEKSGSFLNWEGRVRKFDAAVNDSLNRSDLRILSMIADEIGESIMLGTVTQAAREIASLGAWDGSKLSFSPVSTTESSNLSGDQAVLSTWRRLLDLGTLQKGEENLAGTARKSVAVISQKRAAALGVSSGDSVRVSNSHGAIAIPVSVGDIHDDAIWMPRNSRGSQTLISLNAVNGDVVTVVKA